MMAIAEEKVSDQVSRAHELGDLARYGLLDLRTELPLVTGNVRPQETNGEKVLISRGAACLSGQEMAEGLLMKYPRLGIHEIAHVVPSFPVTG
jgi:hypothetical protein